MLIPVSIAWTWTVTGELDTSQLAKGQSYEVELPLKLNGQDCDGWVHPVTLHLEPPQGPKPAPTTLDPKTIQLGRYHDYPFPSFTAQGSGNIRLIATTTQRANLPSALIVHYSHAKIKGTKLTIPLSISWTWNVTGRLRGRNLKEGSTYEIRLPLKLNGENGESYDGWSNPLSLQLRLPGPRENQLPANTVYPESISLEEYQDFAFPKFVARGGPGSVEFTATTTQLANLWSSLLINKGRAKISQVLLPVSVTWTWMATGEFDTSKLAAGTTYTVELPLMWNDMTSCGGTVDEWVSPLTLDLEPPQGEKPPPNAVDLQLLRGGRYRDFCFPSFTVQGCGSGSGSIRITASTSQSANLFSGLRINNGEAKIKGTDFTIPLSFSWAWRVTGQVEAKSLSQGSTYEILLPLRLHGAKCDAWSKPLILQLQLPGGQSQSPPNIVDPLSIPWECYQDYPFPRFVASGSSGNIDITATTAQTAELPYSLLVADRQAKIREV